MIIQLRFAQLQFTEHGAVTMFNDGATWGALPHPEQAHYRDLAKRWYGGNVLRYCQEHELCHHVVAEMFGSHSLVLAALAHGEQPTPMIAAAEEGLVMHLQRFVTTGEHPCVDAFPWERARDRFKEVLIN